jgi:hypothetical protein
MWRGARSRARENLTESWDLTSLNAKPLIETQYDDSKSYNIKHSYDESDLLDRPEL